jgi:DMSO reductase anchor subunit
MTKKPRHQKPNQWFYTLLGYLLIAAALIVAAIVFGLAMRRAVPVLDNWKRRHGVSEEALQRWFFFAFNTVFLFGILIKQSKRQWRSPVFWTTLLVSLVAHSAAWWEIFKVIPQWRPIWWAWTLPLEAGLIGGGLLWANGHFKRRGRRRHASTSFAPGPDTPARRNGRA